MVKFNTPAKRIKLARYLTGLERKDIEEKFLISYNTLQSWELGRNQLTKKGAEKLSKAFLQEGILCSPEWLLDAEGEFPSFLPNMNKFAEDANNEEIIILREVEAFKAINPDPIVTMVPDDAMLPFYELGTYVGGNKKFNHDINSLIGTNCIIETINGDTLIRKLLGSKKNRRYNLVCLNLNTNIQPVIEEMKLVYAAQIVWIRKRDGLTE